MDNNWQSQYSLIPCDRVFSRVEKNLSSFTTNNLIDTDAFFPEIKWFIASLGLAMFEKEEVVVYLKDFKTELPCDFYLLDSAWLCDGNSQKFQDAFQSQSVVFNSIDTEVLVTGEGCAPTSPPWGVTVSSCGEGHLLSKVTTTQYVRGSNPNVFNWHNPVLMRLNQQKNVGHICTKKCKCLFSSSAYEISINKQGGHYYLYSTLCEPVIYLKYWKFPIDRSTNLPMIPDDAIIEKAIEYHLTNWLLVQLWTNGEITDAENKIKFWEQKAAQAKAEAASYSVTPSYNKMINTVQRERKRFNTFELQNYHW